MVDSSLLRLVVLRSTRPMGNTESCKHRVTPQHFPPRPQAQRDRHYNRYPYPGPYRHIAIRPERALLDHHSVNKNSPSQSLSIFNIRSVLTKISLFVKASWGKITQHFVTRPRWWTEKPNKTYLQKVI